MYGLWGVLEDEGVDRYCMWRCEGLMCSSKTAKLHLASFVDACFCYQNRKDIVLD